MTRSSEIKKPHGLSRRVTLSDVARRVGVSVSTVSLALNGKGKSVALSDDLIRRVNEAARLLDYSPNLLIRNMQAGRSGILTLFNCMRYTPPVGDEYFTRLLSMLGKAAGEIDYDVLTICNFPQSLDVTYHRLNGGHCDGVILYAPAVDEPLLPRLAKSRLPVVLLNRADPMGQISSVKDDVVSAMRLVAKNLTDRGHRTIGALTSNSTNADGPERVALLSACCAEFGLLLLDKHIVTVEHSEMQVADAVRFLTQSSNAPTALFCWQDLVATLAVEQCANMGISVPGDLSIIGYDGVVWPGHTAHRIATVKVNLDKTAQRSVQILSQLIENPEAGPIIETVPVQFQPGTTLASRNQRH